MEMAFDAQSEAVQFFPQGSPTRRLLPRPDAQTDELARSQSLNQKIRGQNSSLRPLFGISDPRSERQSLVVIRRSRISAQKGTHVFACALPPSLCRRVTHSSRIPCDLECLPQAGETNAQPRATSTSLHLVILTKVPQYSGPSTPSPSRSNPCA
jgi:hypothetical protein